MKLRMIIIPLLGVLAMSTTGFADDLPLRLRTQSKSAESENFQEQMREVVWSANETAFIVCDVWDAHHCLNAVRRLEEFAPRMNEVLAAARKRGATIIHAPSDCMPAYESHPARKRALDAPVAKSRPRDIEHWCSRIPTEEQAVYPLDQSDGGEDDDPREHAEWAGKLTAMGRNPGMPWKTQSKLIEIDEARDFISDRGDEVWNVLESRGIKNVVLVGVHLNMCVLGRPFGLRQMVRGGKQVALMRDMTDCMYCPKRWPYVDHFTGNELMVQHVERYVCPTITSDQIVGGQPFHSKFDVRSSAQTVEKKRSPDAEWTPVAVPSMSQLKSHGNSPAWYRCVVRLPKNWANAETLRLKMPERSSVKIWLNGEEAVAKGDNTYAFAAKSIVPDDYHLLVVRMEGKSVEQGLHGSPVLISGSEQYELKGQWQLRIGDEKAWSNIPLPAKFGGSTDMLFEPGSASQK